MTAYYNEFDPHAADWLRNLIEEGLIADGIVDSRTIQEVTPDDLKGFKQAHFFAGIGGWSYALRLAGWPDERPVWTGSCPCQSFSTAGKRQGASDERHLWPDWFRLIEKCQPPTVFGEQVAGAIGFGWLDAVATDFESQDYAFASAVLSGFTVGAHHKRQRLWFVADSQIVECDDGFSRNFAETHEKNGVRGKVGTGRSVDKKCLADSDQSGREAWIANGMGKKSHPSREAIEWVECQDGKTRPIPLEPNVQPLVDGIPEVLDREGNTHKYSYSNALKGVGNAIIPEVAALFISAFRDITE